MAFFHYDFIHNCLILLVKRVPDVVDLVQDFVLELSQLLVDEVLFS
jgi:hypothetical protein